MVKPIKTLRKSLVPIFLFVSERQVHDTFSVVAGTVLPSRQLNPNPNPKTCISLGVVGYKIHKSLRDPYSSVKQVNLMM